MKKFHKFLRAFVLSGLVGVYVAISAFSSRKLNENSVKQICIDIEQYDDKYLIGKDEILNICRVSLNNDSIIYRKSINIRLLEEILEEQKSIENTEIFFTLNGELHIHVKPRYPSMRILNPEKNYYVDLHNQKFPLSRYYTVNVPVVEGAVNDEVIRSLNSILQLGEKDAFLKNFFSGFYVSPNGDITAFSTMYKERIIFGKFENVEEKLLRLKIFYTHIYPTLENKQVKRLNLTFGKQVICEYEQ